VPILNVFKNITEHFFFYCVNKWIESGWNILLCMSNNISDINSDAIFNTLI